MSQKITRDYSAKYGEITPETARKKDALLPEAKTETKIKKQPAGRKIRVSIDARA